MQSLTFNYSGVVGRALVAVLAVTGAGTSLAQSPQSIDKRLTLIERKLDNAALGAMANQMQALRQQVQNLRGENERMRHQIQELKQRQRNIYSDIDSRLRALEQGTTAPPSSTGSQHSSLPGKKSPEADKKAVASKRGSPGDAASDNVVDGGTAQAKEQVSGGDKVVAQSGNPVEPTEEYEAYERAFNMLREGRYAKSQQAFSKFLQRYPKGQYADNARYWLGESYYAGRQFDQAMDQFQKLLENFPHSRKRSGAQLKIGFIQFEQGKLAQARKTLSEVIQRYPDSTVANLAQQRLRLIDSSQ